jgi:hypothetical protein
MQTTKNIEWTAGTGQKVVFTVLLVTEKKESHYNDGDRTESVKAVCEIKYSATIDGVDCGSNWLKDVKNHPVVVACMGDKLGVKKENYDRIMAAVVELKNTEYYQAWQAKQKAADAELSAYYAHVARVEKMMNP